MKNLIFLLLMFLAFGCQQNATNQQAETSAVPASEKPAVNEGFQNLFEEVNVVKMHLFATNEATPAPENYPYTGKPITGDMAQYLGDGLQPNEIGGVFACYRTENTGYYILRVPGKYASSDLVLCNWDNAAGKLKKVVELAHVQCDEGLCHQQDAWLTDLDDDRKLELITRSHTRDAKGNVSDETFEVTTDNGSGSFVKTDEKLASLAVKSNYVMQ